MSEPLVDPPITSLGGWTVARTTGQARALHERPLPSEPVPAVWCHTVTEPALVLGSSQDADVLATERAEADGIEICRRRSGGGVVALTADDCWVDVILPASSRLWVDDVGAAFVWLGTAWADALAQLLGTRAGAIAVHSGRLQGGPAGRLVCFASLGPGEVTVGGNKVVGMSQRRTRAAVRFQCVAIGRWRPDLLTRYLDPRRLREVDLDLAELPAGLSIDHWPGPTAMAEALIEHLPYPGSRSEGMSAR